MVIQKGSADEEALAALERGDRKEALAILMRAHGDAVYRHCRVLLQDEHLADDVLQTVFIQAHRDLPRFAGRSSLKTWLFGIARHRCLDALRLRQRRRNRDAGADALLAEPDPTPGAEAALATAGAAVELESCLQELRPEVRVAVMLRYRENMTYADIARICGERINTLHARVSRALPVLRRCLESRGVQL